jgi:hypothetical protein
VQCAADSPVKVMAILTDLRWKLIIVTARNRDHFSHLRSFSRLKMNAQAMASDFSFPRFPAHVCIPEISLILQISLQ